MAVVIVKRGAARKRSRPGLGAELAALEAELAALEAATDPVVGAAAKRLERLKKEIVAKPAPARPFIKWAGGKTQLLGELVERLPETFVGYHEPFVGGGALFWKLAELRRLRKGQVVLSDACAPLVRAWRGVKDDAEGLVHRLGLYPVTAAHFDAVRQVDPMTLEEDAEAAAWFIYLNKTGYNGMYRVNLKGRFNIPWGHWEEQGRTPAVLDEPNLLACAEVLTRLRVAVTTRPFEEVLHYARPGDLVYLDPPYLPRSATSDFTSYTPGGFGFDDHRRLRDVARELKERGVYIMLSNSDTPLIRELYESWSAFRVDVVEARRSINSKGDGRGAVREIIVR